MGLTRVKEFAGRYAKAWCSQDPESVAAFFGESAALAVNDDPPAVGRKAIADVARGFMTAFPDMVVTLDDLVPKPHGTEFEFHWTLTGTNTGPGGTGHRVRISGHELWQFDTDGLIGDSKGHFDSAEYQRQLQHGVSD